MEANDTGSKAWHDRVEGDIPLGDGIQRASLEHPFGAISSMNLSDDF
jgi:hypothetical protein